MTRYSLVGMAPFSLRGRGENCTFARIAHHPLDAEAVGALGRAFSAHGVVLHRHLDATPPAESAFEQPAGFLDAVGGEGDVEVVFPTVSVCP